MRRDQFLLPPPAPARHLAALGRVRARRLPLLGQAAEGDHPQEAARGLRRPARRRARANGGAGRKARHPARPAAAEPRFRARRRRSLLRRPSLRLGPQPRLRAAPPDLVRARSRFAAREFGESPESPPIRRGFRRRPSPAAGGALPTTACTALRPYTGRATTTAGSKTMPGNSPAARPRPGASSTIPPPRRRRGMRSSSRRYSRHSSSLRGAKR